jgi:hypothetical protein
MDNLEIKGENGEYFIPTVDFNASTGNFLLSGASYLEDTTKFYEPILKWLMEYIRDINKPINFEIRLNYFNTSSSRSLLDMFYIIKDFKNNGGKVKIDWYIKQFDHDMYEEIEDYILDTGLEINAIRTEKL